MTLRSGSPERVQRMFAQMKRDTEGIITRLVELTYYMRGGIQYKDAFFMTPGERDIADTFIRKHLENEGNKMYPQY